MALAMVALRSIMSAPLLMVMAPEPEMSPPALLRISELMVVAALTAWELLRLTLSWLTVPLVMDWL